jgi:hypothetical protein
MDRTEDDVRIRTVPHDERLAVDVAACMAESGAEVFHGGQRGLAG